MTSIEQVTAAPPFLIYRQAVTLDPTFARAWASMADTYTAIARNLLGRPDQYMSLARDAAQRAASLDSSSTEPHTALAAIAYFADHDWDRADREFRRAIALDSRYAEAHYLYAHHSPSVEQLSDDDGILDDVATQCGCAWRAAHCLQSVCRDQLQWHGGHPLVARQRCGMAPRRTA